MKDGIKRKNIVIMDSKLISQWKQELEFTKLQYIEVSHIS